VLYLALNLSVGTLLIAAGYGVPGVVPLIQKRLARKKGRVSGARDEWVANHALQLQRMAFQAEGKGEWEREEEFVPVTVDLTQRFRALDPCSHRGAAGKPGDRQLLNEERLQKVSTAYITEL